MKTFDILVPVYQNEANLSQTVPRLLSLRDDCLNEGYKLKIVFIDDGSTDNSYLILREFQKNNDCINLIKLTRNFGQIYAIQAGINHSKADCIGVISADLQDPETLFIEMLQKLKKNISLVIAERSNREESITQRFFSSLYWQIIRRYGVAGFPKGGFDFCLFSSNVAKSISTISEKNTNIFPAIFWLGYNYEIIKYKRNKREKGSSTWTLSKKIALTVDTLISFTKIPIRFITYTGIVVSFLSLLYVVFVVIFKLLGYGSFPLGWTSLVVFISFFFGVVLFSLGIISEYLQRILDEARGRPNYIIEEIISSDDYSSTLQGKGNDSI